MYLSLVIRSLRFVALTAGSRCHRRGSLCGHAQSVDKKSVVMVSGRSRLISRLLAKPAQTQ